MRYHKIRKVPKIPEYYRIKCRIFAWKVICGRDCINKFSGNDGLCLGYRKRFCKDLKPGIDGIVSVLGKDTQEPAAMYASILGKMDYVLRGADFF